MQRIKFTFLILTVLIFKSLQAQVTPTVVAEDVLNGSSLYYNHTPNVARSSDGDLDVVWNSGDDQVVYSEFDETFGNWSPAVQISNAGDIALKAGITNDENGNLYAVWQQRETSDEDYAIYFSKKSGGSWSTPQNLTGNDAENEECGIEVSDEGVIFVAWNTGDDPDSSEFVYCITSSDQGDTWSDPAVLSSEDGTIGGTSTTSGRPYLAKASNGKMICAWHEEPDGHPDREGFTNQFDGTSWEGEKNFIYADDSSRSYYPGVAVDSEDNIYMFLYSSSNDEAVLVSKAWNEDWDGKTAQVLFTDPNFTKPIAVTDYNDNLYLFYRSDIEADTLYGLEDIEYRTSQDKGVTWSDPVVLSRTNHDAGYVSVAKNVGEHGIDILWRESSSELIDDSDTTDILYANLDILVGIKQVETDVPSSYRMGQNYPNPFNPSTIINFSIPERGLVTLKIYNMLGEEIAELVNNVKDAGSYEVSFKAVNLASGTYIYKIQSGDFTATKKMMLIK